MGTYNDHQLPIILSQLNNLKIIKEGIIREIEAEIGRPFVEISLSRANPVYEFDLENSEILTQPFRVKYLENLKILSESAIASLSAVVSAFQDKSSGISQTKILKIIEDSSFKSGAKIATELLDSTCGIKIGPGLNGISHALSLSFYSGLPGDYNFHTSVNLNNVVQIERFYSPHISVCKDYDFSPESFETPYYSAINGFIEKLVPWVKFNRYPSSSTYTERFELNEFQ